MKKLPYRARTATGDVFEIEFPLHHDTGCPVRVSQLISVLLDAIDRDIAVIGETSNGDVLQAVAMTMAIRTGMIHAPHETCETLSKQLLNAALGAVAGSIRHSPNVGHA